MPSSRHVRGEPALRGGVGMGAWASQDGGHSMAVDSVTDMADAGASARQGVGGLGLGQRTKGGGGTGIGGSGVPKADGLRPDVHGAHDSDHIDDPAGGIDTGRESRLWVQRKSVELAR